MVKILFFSHIYTASTVSRREGCQIVVALPLSEWMNTIGILGVRLVAFLEGEEETIGYVR